MIGGLQVEDHRHRALELVGDLLGVVEVARDDEVDLDVGVAVADRRAGPGSGEAAIGSSSAKMSSISSRRARREVGRRRTWPDPSRRASRSSSGVGDEFVLVLGAVVVVLGEAEVDERFVPCVSECHISASFGLERPIPLPIMPASAVTCRARLPSRMIVAPSATATRQSWEVPIESRSRPCSAASSARRAKCGREASGSWLKGGIVIRPETRTGQRSMKPPRSPGATPPLPSSPATLTSTRTSVSGVAVAPELLEGRVGGDRVDQAADRQQLLDLAALEVADEVPGERVPPALVLRGQVLLAVLADQRHPGLGQDAHLLERHVLGRRQHLDPLAGDLAHPLEVGGDPRPGRCLRSGPAPQPSLDPDEPGLAPGPAAVAAVGEEALPLAAVQSPAASTRSTPASASSRRATSVRSSIGPRRADRRGRRRSRGPPRRPRSSRARSRARSRRRLRRRLDPAGDDPGRQPAPAAVEHRHPARAREGDREAVGGEDERGQAGLGGDLAVDLGQLGAGRGERARALRARGGPRARRRGPGARSGTRSGSRPSADVEPAPVLDHRRRRRRRSGSRG